MTLYDRIRNKATDVCKRIEAETWTHEVKMIINKIMDTVKLKMDEYLEKECTEIGGTWYTNTLGGVPDDYKEILHDPEGFGRVIPPNDTFYNKTGASNEWGYCDNPDHLVPPPPLP